MQGCQMNARQAFSNFVWSRLLLKTLPNDRGVCVCVGRGVAECVQGAGGERGGTGEMSRQETHVDRFSQLSHPHWHRLYSPPASSTSHWESDGDFVSDNCVSTSDLLWTGTYRTREHRSAFTPWCQSRWTKDRTYTPEDYTGSVENTDKKKKIYVY